MFGGWSLAQQTGFDDGLPDSAGIEGAEHRRRPILGDEIPVWDRIRQWRYNPVHVEVDARDGLVSSGLDLGIDVLVSARRDPRAPQGLRDILHPADRNTRQQHLHQRFLDRRLPLR